MESARREYRRRLQGRIVELEGAVQRLPSASADAAGEVRRIAHQLHGSGGTYGFPRISEAAGAVERASEDTLAGAAQALLAVLREVVAEEPGADVPPVRAPGAAVGTGPVILLVDDDPDITRLLDAVLAAPGRRIAVAESAHEARAILAGTEVSLVLLDLFLPDDDGRRLLAEIRRGPATATLPVFVLSARVGGTIKTECYGLGADGYFEKPVDPVLLLAAVNSRLGRHTGPAPAAAVLEPGKAAAAAAAVAGRTGTGVVLLAEDDELIASVVRHRLGREGFTVRHFADGAAAFAAACDGPADLAILDVKMPGMDGFELLARLRELPAWEAVPVLILTSLGGERDLVRAFDLGASDYVLKPFSPTELVARVRHLLPG